MPPLMHNKKTASKRAKKSVKKKRTKIVVLLSDADLAFLNGIIRSGKRSVRIVTRARILLLSHNGKTNAEIMNALECSHTAIADIRSRYVAQNRDVKTAITDAPRPGQPKKILPKHESFVVATACTDAPEGHAHWTLGALKQKLIETYEEIRTVSDERIRQILLANELKPWREKNVVHPKAHAPLS